MLLVFGILLFILLIIVHELGHFMAARMSGVEVEEFGIGFPPRALSRRHKNGTIYSINWLPLGGFVKLKGEHDSDSSQGSYGAAPLGKKAFILMAGVMMNLLAAAVILTVLSFSGMPRLVDNQFSIKNDTTIAKSEVVVAYVVEGSPADMAGIEEGNRLISVAGQNLSRAEELAPLTESHSGQEVEVVVARAEQVETLNVRLNPSASSDGYLGVSAGDFILERSTWSSPIRGVALMGQFTWLTLEGLASTVGSLFMGNGAQAADNVAGPVGIVVLLNDVSQAGVGFVLMFVSLISITLAVMNALPIPALDGGRLFVTLLFRALKKPLKPEVEERIHATGMALLLGLVVLITVIDVRRFL